MIDALEPPGRIGLIGAGAFGRFCLDAYQAAPDLDVVAVADPDPAALALVPNPGVRLEPAWEQVVQSQDIEVVHIVTPPHIRRPIAEAAIAAGKSVFCEKPPALSLSELDAMLAAARTHNVVFGADYVMRHLPAYHFLIDLARAGVLGEPRTVSFVNLAQSVPRDHWFWDRERSGGIFVEHGVHFFDVYGQILGAPRSVRAEDPRPQASVATVEYLRGATATYFHEFAYPCAVERTQSILGFDRATVQVEGWIPTRLAGTALTDVTAVHDVARAAGISLQIIPGDAVSFAATFPDRQSHYRRAIATGMRDVVRRHRDPAQPLTPVPGEIRDSLALALAAQRAADSGGSVPLSEVVGSGMGE